MVFIITNAQILLVLFNGLHSKTILLFKINMKGGNKGRIVLFSIKIEVFLII